jgi:uncharacterized protein (DUF342 family)
MAFELEFIVGFEGKENLKARYDSLDELFALPVKVEKGQKVVRELEAGSSHPDGKRGPRYLLKEPARIKDVIVGKLAPAPDDDSTLISALDGYLCARGERLAVTVMMEIFGDVSPHTTGDIHVGGPIRIHGGVLSGVTVQAGGDVETLGLVEEANIRSAGNVMLKGGFAGGNSGKIFAGKNVYSTFVQFGTVEAEQSIAVDGPVMNSDLSAGGKIVLRGRASLVGGVTRARELISAPVVGSEGAAPTEISLGRNPFIARKSEERKEMSEKMKEAMRQREMDLEFTAKSLSGMLEVHHADPLSDALHLSDLVRDGVPDKLDETRREKFKEAGSALLSLIYMKDVMGVDMNGGQEGDLPTDAPYLAATLKAEKVAHPGVVVSILGQTLKLDKEYDRVRFILKDGLVVEAGL